MSTENVLWNAIEACIGPEKTAHLRNTPLSGIAKQKIAAEHDIPPNSDTFMADAMSVIGMQRMEKSATYKTIKKAVDNLPDDKKRGSKNCFKKLATSEKYRMFEDRADGKERQNIREMRKEADRKALDKIKKSASSILSGLKSVAKEYGPKAGKGFAVGTGAAIPAYGAGSLLIGDAEESSENVMEDARNKALQTGIGLGGMYLAGKGASEYMGGGGGSENVKQSSNRMSDAELDEKLANFSAAVMIDNILEKTGGRGQHEKLAEINTDYGVDLALDILIR